MGEDAKPDTTHELAKEVLLAVVKRIIERERGLERPREPGAQEIRDELDTLGLKVSYASVDNAMRALAGEGVFRTIPTYSFGP